MMIHTIFRPGRWMLGLAVLGLAAALCPAQSESGYALIVEQTPDDGGAVTPNSGVHKFGVNQMVTLMAEPKSGYRFLYWLPSGWIRPRLWLRCLRRHSSSCPKRSVCPTAVAAARMMRSAFDRVGGWDRALAAVAAAVRL
jgi:hypothetical protein